MCKELNDEIERGDRAVRELARHLVAMGAANMERTIAIENFLVTIRVDIKAKIDSSL